MVRMRLRAGAFLFVFFFLAPHNHRLIRISNRISTHWQWVLMVVILIVGFSLIAVVGIWLKRRYDAKHQNLYHGDDSGLGQPSGVIRARGGSMTRRSPAAGFFFSSGA